MDRKGGKTFQKHYLLIENMVDTMQNKDQKIVTEGIRFQFQCE